MRNLKIIATLLSVLFSLVPVMNSSVMATGMEMVDSEFMTEVKMYSSATLEDNFTDDCVIVVMTNEASLLNLNYSASDFSEVKCKSVRNLSQAKTEKVEVKLSGGNIAMLCSDNTGQVALSDFYDVKLDGFNQILSLELEGSGKENVLAAIEILEERSDVLYAGPNYVYSVDAYSSASEYQIPSYLQPNTLRSVTTHDEYASDQWAIENIDLSSAWDIVTGMNNIVTVGIIDMGIDASHPDLRTKINTVDSRVIDRAGGVNTVSAVVDPTGHGSMMAGIIGAGTNNGIGISGVNWNVKMVSISVYNSSGELTTSALAAAIDYAEGKNIPLINLSLNIPLEYSYETDELDDCVYESIENYSGLLICSAGNKNEDNDETGNRCPSSYDLDNIVVVGASTQFNTMWSSSNYGSNSVDLFAPGAAIYSIAPTNRCTTASCTLSTYHIATGYHAASGTSAAAPYVTGVASLLLSMDDDMSTAQIKYHIMNGVDVSNAYQGKCVTGGRLNAYKVLNGHSLTLFYTDEGASGHYSYCACGHYELKDHNFVDIGGLLVCSECEYVI